MKILSGFLADAFLVAHLDKVGRRHAKVITLGMIGDCPDEKPAALGKFLERQMMPFLFPLIEPRIVNDASVSHDFEIINFLARGECEADFKLRGLPCVHTENMPRRKALDLRANERAIGHQHLSGAQALPPCVPSGIAIEMHVHPIVAEGVVRFTRAATGRGRNAKTTFEQAEIDV